MPLDALVSPTSPHDVIITVAGVGSALLSAHSLRGTMGTVHLRLSAASAAAAPAAEASTITVAYTALTPFVHPRNTLGGTRRWAPWSHDGRTLMCGHRGVGKSFKQPPGIRKAAVRENTLLSFATAARLGADFVEFDVMLTSDGVPVVYHDFSVEVSLSEEAEEGVEGTTEALDLGVHELSARALRRVHIHHRGVCALGRLVRKHWRAILAMAGATSSRPLSTSCKLIRALYQPPTLAALLASVPAHVGLDVEIKYPTEVCHQPLLGARGGAAFEINAYVDAMLRVVAECAGPSRPLFYSSFHPEVCAALHWKQAVHPVLFLTEGRPAAGSYGDVRSNSLTAAVANARRDNLQGIAPNVGAMLIHPTKLDTAGLRVATWGQWNTQNEVVASQRADPAVDMIIVDNIGDYTEGRRWRE